MAGVTTASRMSLGAVASSEDMNPVGFGEAITWGSGNNQYWIQGLHGTVGQKYHDLEIWLKSSNQSTWTTWWAFTWATAGQTQQTSAMHSSYYYGGYSTGASQGTNNGSYAYNYPNGYSSYGHGYFIYLSNFSSSSNIKSWHGRGGYTNGGATSYVTCQQGGGSINITQPIDSIYIQNGYGNGSSSYQGFTVFGRRPK